MEEHQPPVNRLDYLDVVPVRECDGSIRVHVSDARCGLVLLSLTARDAAYLGGSLVSASARAGRVGRRGEEGDEDPPEVSWSGHDPGQ